MDAWFASAVEWAADKGIVNGVGDDKFAPNAAITREQMVVMLVNYVRFKAYALPNAPAPEAAFADERSISGWAADAVATLHGTGIINGKQGNIFDPQGMATRAEVSATFDRFIRSLAVQ